MLSFAPKIITYKATAELLCISVNQWFKGPKESCLLHSWINQPFEGIELTICNVYLIIFHLTKK